ncbi:MAG: radical SAM protein [Deltaproteobacteria bacterium]|nr:radical SAM protein [Deltaproteobacteria bacterium]
MKYTYGPVPSRRLGLSLGVDLVPKKICTYNCIYCQIGRPTLQTVERKEYVPARSILLDVEQSLQEWGAKIDYIAISGSGEPTLNSAIGEIIQGIKKLTTTSVAVITNSSLLHLEEVRQALRAADVVMPSLDAVTPSVFQTINRPLPFLEIEQIIQGLAAFRGEYKGQIWLEILLCRGINDAGEEIERMREAIHIIRPDKVQLNTVVRPGVEDYAAALSPDQMEQIKNALGADVEIIAEFEGDGHRMPQEAIEERVIRIIQRRPETPDDLAKALGLNDLEIAKILDKLAKEGKVTYRVFNQRVYYEAAKKADKSGSR